MLCADKHPESVPALRLATYAQASARWRAVGGLLVALTRPWSPMPEAVITLVTRVERRWPVAMEDYYRLALNYFFWAGMRAAQSRPLRTRR